MRIVITSYNQDQLIITREYEVVDTESMQENIADFIEDSQNYIDDEANLEAEKTFE